MSSWPLTLKLGRKGAEIIEIYGVGSGLSLRGKKYLLMVHMVKEIS